YKVGDVARDFSLKNVDGKTVSLSDFKNQKGAVVIFTCNHCPYSVAYEDRIIELHNEFAAKGYPVVAINPNDPVRQPEDAFEKMKIRAKEKGFPFVYLADETQEITRAYGATRTPHVFLLKNDDGKMVVSYIGAIDENTEDASEVKEPYVADAINALLKGETPKIAVTKAIGCTIKWKK
ncbi:MAG TPA: thioredoxin family protein, partial [Patescibacteria group bacterium]|nr:thioredoxin family protein [Patescibacteria group bacterium]